MLVKFDYVLLILVSVRLVRFGRDPLRSVQVGFGYIWLVLVRFDNVCNVWLVLVTFCWVGLLFRLVSLDL